MGRRDAGSVIWLLSSSTTTGNRRPAMQGNRQAAQVAPTTRTWAEGCERHQLLRKQEGISTKEPAGGIRTEGGNPCTQGHRPLCPLPSVPPEKWEQAQLPKYCLLAGHRHTRTLRGNSFQNITKKSEQLLQSRVLHVRVHTHFILQLRLNTQHSRVLHGRTGHADERACSRSSTLLT